MNTSTKAPKSNLKFVVATFRVDKDNLSAFFGAVSEAKALLGLRANAVKLIDIEYSDTK